MDEGFYVLGESEYVSPTFVVPKLKNADESDVDNRKRHSERNFIITRQKTMDELRQELEEHIPFRVVVDFDDNNNTDTLVLNIELLGLEWRGNATRHLWISSMDWSDGFLSRSYQVHGSDFSIRSLDSY